MNRLPRKDLERPAHPTQEPKDGMSGRRLLYEPKHDVREAAKMMMLGETTLRRLIRNGDIPVIRIGSKILILESDMEACLANGYSTANTTITVKTTSGPRLPNGVLNSKHLR